MFYAVGQGAIAIEIRRGDDRIKQVLRGCGHWESEWTVGAERALLRELEGGCSVPVGVEATIEEVTKEGTSVKSPFEDLSVFSEVTATSPLLHSSGAGRSAVINLSACVTSMDGCQQVIHRPGPVLITSYEQAEAWGQRVAKEIKTMGADVILEEINAIRREREANQGKDEVDVVDPVGHTIAT